MGFTERLLKSDEGFSSAVYEDNVGHKTFAYGFNLDAGITTEEASALLEVRIRSIRRTLQERTAYFNGLSLARQAVLVNIAYNVGIHGLFKFKKMLAAIEEGNFARASMELLDSQAARMLPERYTRLSKYMLTGIAE